MKPIPFGKYLLLEKISTGGMAEIFKAKTFGIEGFERFVAVKKILPAIADDKGFVQMFIDEAKIAVQLNHSNIVQIYDLGKVNESYFIAMEYVPGKDLRSLFEFNRKFNIQMSIEQICFIMMRVCEGLDYAHNKKDPSGMDLGIIHRDVSPQNIIASYEGDVKIIDFGIAKAAGKASKTQAGILKGKFSYMSPEQVRGLSIDKRSDIFSVGIIIYELMTGQRLFYADTDFSTLEKVRNVEILPPSTYRKEIPYEAENIILKALSKDLDERYASSQDLQDDLQKFLFQTGSFYSRRDLSEHLKMDFAADYAKELAAAEEFKKINLSESISDLEEGAIASFINNGLNKTPIEPYALTDDSGIRLNALEWNDDEIETELYTKNPLKHPDLKKSTAVSLKKMSGAPFFMKSKVTLISLVTLLAVLLAAVIVYFSTQRELATILVTESTPPGVEIYADGKFIGYTPKEIKQKPGKYLFVFKKKGYEEISRALDLKVDEKKIFQFKMKSQEVKIGLKVDTNPLAAFIKINEKWLSNVTPLFKGLRKGRYQIVVQKEGYATYTKEVIIDNSVLNLKVDLIPKKVDLQVTSIPTGAKFLISGDKLKWEGVTPKEIKNIDTSLTYQLKVDKPGYKPYTEEILFTNELAQSRLISLERAIKEEKEVLPPKKEPPPDKTVKVERPKETPKPKEVKPPKEVAKITPEKKPVEKPLQKEKGKEPTTDAKVGFLNCNSKPWANILINGKEIGLTTPVFKYQLPAGKHTLILSNKKFNLNKLYIIDIKPTETTTILNIP